MSEERKKSRVALLATVAVVAVLVIYPMSFGPFLWLVNHEAIPDFAVTLIGAIYLPLSWIGTDGPVILRQPLLWYLGLWTDLES